MKRILVLINGLYLGGFSKSLINLLLCLQEDKDITIELCSFDSNHMLLKNDLPEGINIKYMDPLEYNNSLFICLSSFANKLRYVFFEKANSIFFSRDIPRKHVTRFVQKKLIIKAKSITSDFSFASAYDCVISWEEGFCNYVLAYKIKNKNKIGYIHPNYREVGLNKNVDKGFIKRMKYVVTISESCFNTLCDVFPWAKNKIKYVPNRMHYAYLVDKSRQYLVNRSKKYTICTVSRIVDYDKAVFRIIKLAKKLLLSGLDFCWYVIGDGIDLDEFRTRLHNERIENTVISVGGLTNPYPYIVASDLFVMQSHREGRPVAVDEAMLLGKPVLITNYSSAHEQVEENVTGFIVKDNFDAIFEKLYYLIENRVSTVDRDCIIQRITDFEDCTKFKELIM